MGPQRPPCRESSHPLLWRCKTPEALAQKLICNHFAGSLQLLVAFPAPLAKDATMAMTWMFVLVVCFALCMFGAVIAVMVAVFRAASRQPGSPPRSTTPPVDDGHVFIPPILPGDDSIHRQHQIHQTTMDAASPPPSMPDASPTSSFDSSPAPSSFDSGSSAPSCDTSGQGCG